MTAHTKPALHNAMWPGLVGKGPDSKPPIDLDTCSTSPRGRSRRHTLRLGRSLSLRPPRRHRLRSRRAEAARRSRPRTGVCGRIARGARVAADRRIGHWKRRRPQALPHAGEKGVRDRQNSARARFPSVRRPAHHRRPVRTREDPAGNTKRIAETFREACAITDSYGERLAAEGEISGAACTAGSACSGCSRWWAGRSTLGFQADMAHNAVHDRLQRARGSNSARGLRLVRSDTLDRAIKTMTGALRPWTIDFHVAQNERRSRDRGPRQEGRHCLPGIPTGRWTSSASPARGCAMRRASRRARSSTSAGTVACFQTPR